MVWGRRELKLRIRDRERAIIGGYIGNMYTWIWYQQVTFHSRSRDSRDKVLIPWHRRDFTKFYGTVGSYTNFCGTERIGSKNPRMMSVERIHACPNNFILYSGILSKT
jgi:hypothetical protein